jgi:hypothetical protein
MSSYTFNIKEGWIYNQYGLVGVEVPGMKLCKDLKKLLANNNYYK